MTDTNLRPALKLDIVVIGAGQAGLSAAYHLKHLGLEPLRDFIVLDGSPRPGGAWQYRWPSLTLTTVNGVRDLPGMGFSDFASDTSVQASVAVPEYFAAYEAHFDLKVQRPARVSVVCDRGERLRVECEIGIGIIPIVSDYFPIPIHHRTRMAAVRLQLAVAVERCPYPSIVVAYGLVIKRSKII